MTSININWLDSYAHKPVRLLSTQGLSPRDNVSLLLSDLENPTKARSRALDALFSAFMGATLAIICKLGLLYGVQGLRFRGFKVERKEDCDHLKRVILDD